jgi:hypothetical protein
METIYECLRKAAPRDLSIEEIAVVVKMHRNTVGKYILALERESRIVMTRRLGNAKLYTVSKAR